MCISFDPKIQFLWFCIKKIPEDIRYFLLLLLLFWNLDTNDRNPTWKGISKNRVYWLGVSKGFKNWGTERQMQPDLRNKWNQSLNVSMSCPITLICCFLGVLLFLGQTGFSSQWEALIQWMFLTKEKVWLISNFVSSNTKQFCGKTLKTQSGSEAHPRNSRLQWWQLASVDLCTQFRWIGCVLDGKDMRKHGHFCHSRVVLEKEEGCGDSAGSPANGNFSMS